MDMKKMLTNTLKTVMLPMIVYGLFMLVSFERFSNWQTIYTIFLQSLIPSITAYAVAYGYVAGIFDFTIGARLVISALCGGLFSQVLGLPGLILGCFISAFVMAAITGLLNWVLRIPSLVLTMGLTMIFEIVGKFLAGNYGYIQLDRAYTFFGSSPYIVIVFSISALVFYLIYNNTKFSYHMRAIGSDETVAKGAGILVNRVKLKTFLYGSFFIGIASMLTISQSGSVGAQTNLGSITVVFKPLISILLALVLQRICNLTFGIFIAQLTLTIIFIGLIAVGMPDTSQNVVLGVFLLLVMIIFNNSDKIRHHLNQRKTIALLGEEK
jgi:ribose transport system permease protein